MVSLKFLQRIFAKPQTLDDWQFLKDNLQTFSEIAALMVQAEENRQSKYFIGVAENAASIETLIQQLPKDLQWE